MIKNDPYYSPAWVADLLVGALPKDTSGLIVDPAAGDGRLLESASNRFADAISLAGIDIDNLAVRQLRVNQSTWTISQADFLSTKSTGSSHVGRLLRHTPVNWVLLNPPFSYRGNAGHLIEVEGQPIRVSRPIYFLWRSLTFLRPVEGVLAVLPAGVVDGDRHAAFWALLSQKYEITIEHRLGSRAFPGAVVSCVIVAVRPKSEQSVSKEVSLATAEVTETETVLSDNVCRCFDLIRGRVPVGRSNRSVCHDGDLPFVHTSSLRTLSAGLLLDAFAPGPLASHGELLLLPRVGNPLSFTVISASGPLVLSDCLFAVRANDSHTQASIKAVLEKNWHQFCKSYVGSGARHLTVPRLLDYLSSKGFRGTFVGASVPKSPCPCRTITVTS